MRGITGTPSSEALSENFVRCLGVLCQVNKLFIWGHAWPSAVPVPAPKLLYSIYQSSIFQKFTRTFSHIDLYWKSGWHGTDRELTFCIHGRYWSSAGAGRHAKLWSSVIHVRKVNETCLNTAIIRLCHIDRRSLTDCVRVNMWDFLMKGKAIPLQAWTGHEGSRRLRLPDFKTVGVKVKGGQCLGLTTLPPSS
jgi:hypothetical protein